MSFDPFEFVRALQSQREVSGPQISAVDTSPPIVPDLGPHTPPQVVSKPSVTAPGLLGPHTPKNAPQALTQASGGPWVSVGGKWQLAPTAAEAFLGAQTTAGTGIKLNSAGRTKEQQEYLYRTKGPGIAAKPGHSLHEQGLAIDVDNWRDPRVKNALIQAGWKQFDARKEPWHFSWGRTG